MLDRLAGEGVDEYMVGIKRILGVKHEHSDAAYGLLERYSIDKCHAITVNDYFSKLKKN